MHSAACCVMDPASVTGAVAPARGMLTISAGTPARARSTRFCEANSDQFNGGEGQTSKMARGCRRRASRPPLSMATNSSSLCRLVAEKAPVTIDFSEYHSTSSRRYQSPISGGTSLQTMAVDCAANCGNISATCTRRTRSAESAGRGCCVSASRMFRHDEPGSKWTLSAHSGRPACRCGRRGRSRAGQDRASDAPELREYAPRHLLR